MRSQTRFGPLIEDDAVTFRLWAPGAERVELVTDSRVEAMHHADDGWYGLRKPAAAGTPYRFRIDGEADVPDPASRFQPDDAGGASELVNSSYAWKQTQWRGRPWHEAVFLELHVGTFTPEGTFLGAIDRLADVASAGFTAIELMPVADFSGRWNWGYDGVLWFAPDSTYGRPDDLKTLVDAAHGHGLSAFLDVVYNHFGPDGNYLGRYAPQFFMAANTPWGSAIDYSHAHVRGFAIENAVYWLDEFQFDGLRLDAVHAISEPGRQRLLRELSMAAGDLARRTGRHIHLVLENDANQAALLDPATDPHAGRYRAQWNDDFHHALHVLLTGETTGYYADYRDAARHLKRTLAEGFAYQGEPSPHRDNAPRGESTAGLPATAFVSFLQNHDQIGNRALGERLTELTDPAALEAALSVMLLAPMPPLMFMGEEWGSRAPFPFFCDFGGELAEGVRRGRRTEFRDAYARHGDGVPDPLAEQTVRSARIDWRERTLPPHSARLELVRRLLAARKRWIVPKLPDIEPGPARTSTLGSLIETVWRFGSGDELAILANLGAGAQPRPEGSFRWSCAEPIWGPVPPPVVPGWSVHAAIGRH